MQGKITSNQNTVSVYKVTHGAIHTKEIISSQEKIQDQCDIKTSTMLMIYGNSDHALGF